MAGGAWILFLQLCDSEIESQWGLLLLFIGFPDRVGQGVNAPVRSRLSSKSPEMFIAAPEKVQSTFAKQTCTGRFESQNPLWNSFNPA